MENKNTKYSQNHMDNSFNHATGRSDMTGFDDLSENVDGNKPDSAQSNPRAQVIRSVGYTMIAPNGLLWSNLKTKAQKEEEALQRWREAQRVTTVHVNPERLGGEVSMDEAREKQLIDLRQSKLQKRLKKEEMERRRRQDEKGKLEKMKAEQRDKAERLEERRQQQEQKRREQFRQDQLSVNENFLDKLKLMDKAPMAFISDTHLSSRSEALKENQGDKDEVSKREIQLDHRRVNSAFLDKLEAQHPVMKETGEGKHPSSASEVSKCHSARSSVTQDLLIYSNPDPDPDYDWALMNLESKFPEFSRVFLEDILIQCDGDYQQAYTLLSDTCH